LDSIGQTTFTTCRTEWWNCLKMKSREGTVVDADDLINEMLQTATSMSSEHGKLNEVDTDYKIKALKMIALGALKYFILKVDPKKTITFNPRESIDFNGNTGPFIQYTYARIRSILRKANDLGVNWKIVDSEIDLNLKELELIKKISIFPEIVSEAGSSYSPALIANYCYDLAKEFNQFYHDYTILGEADESKKILRLVLTENTSKVIKIGMKLLGIECPERM